MRNNNRLSKLSIVVLFILLFSLVFPTSVLADEPTPPPAETPEVLPPTEEPSDVSPVLPVTDESPLPEAAIPVESTPVVQEETPASEETETVILTEVVSAAAENNLILADSSGEPLMLGTTEAAETIAMGDPYIVRGGVTYSFMPIGGCGALPNCTESATPIQNAINFALAGETVYVEAGVYNEQLVVNTANLTLYGDPGNLTLPGVGPNAPILDGSGVTGDVGITVFAEGFTLRGFIIQNFDMAIYQKTLSGNNTVTYDNNVIQNNVDGIKVEKAGGSPGIEMHYMVFKNNSGIDLINIDPNGNNVQFINALNNYWGCPDGPVVRHIRTGQGNDKPAGQLVYYLWSASNAPNQLFLVNYPTEYGDCAVLYGNESLYNNNGQTGEYTPFKIIVGSFFTTQEAEPTPALTIVKTATPTTYSAVGNIISYSYLVTNTGNVTLNGPFAVDDNKASVTCPATLSLAPGASITCTASYTITQADLNAGSVTNIASATNGTVTSPTDTETVTAVQGPALTTVKTETSSGPYTVGNTITYSIVVTNTGNVTLTGVTVSDNGALMGTCTPAQPSTLAVGASMTCAASHVVTQADVNNGSYVNTATGDSDQTTPNTSTVTVNFTPTGKPVTPPTRTRPSAAFTGFIPVTGGEAHAIAAGIAHTCAITPEGGVQCWGNNGFGQLGSGSNTSSNVPVDVVGIRGGTTIVAGGNHTCVLSGGDVWCWGQNSQGQVGDGTTVNRNKPVKVLNSAVDITAGLDYTCAIMSYGQVMCWGNNDQGQLADGTKTDSAIPTLATLITGISNVDAGLNKSCGLTNAGLLKCLVGNSAQEIGGITPVLGASPETSLEVAVNRFGTLIMALNNQGVPVAFQNSRFRMVNGVSNAVDVDSGLGHVCTLLRDGTVKCWGSNTYGQLGINSRASSADPQPVLSVAGAWQLAVGKYHACVLINSSTPGTNDIQCWGLNKDGQLGNGTNVDSLVPVFVK